MFTPLLLLCTARRRPMVGAWPLSQRSWEAIVLGILRGIFFGMFDFLWTGLHMLLVVNSLNFHKKRQTPDTSFPEGTGGSSVRSFIIKGRWHHSSDGCAYVWSSWNFATFVSLRDEDSNWITQEVLAPPQICKWPMGPLSEQWDFDPVAGR